MAKKQTVFFVNLDEDNPIQQPEEPIVREKRDLTDVKSLPVNKDKNFISRKIKPGLNDIQFGPQPSVIHYASESKTDVMRRRAIAAMYMKKGKGKK